MADLITEKKKLQKKTSQLLRSAQEAFNNKDYLSAQDYLLEIIRTGEPKPEYFSSLASIQKKLNLFDEAEANYKEALKQQPSFWEASYNLGLLYQEKGKIEDAINFYHSAIGANPNLYLVYYNLGNAFRGMGNLDEAAKHYSKAIEIKDNFADAYYNLGVVYEKKIALDLAVKNYKLALVCDNNHVNAHWNKSILLLLNGDYLNGFKEYEWRLFRKETVKRNFSKPMLNHLNIAGKKVYVYSEQGLGDAIQFVRFLEKLRSFGCYIYFEVDPRLVKLFSDLKFIDKIIPRQNIEEPAVDYDFQIPLLSLPNLFQITTDTIPSSVPYLKADSNKIKSWSKIISSGDFNIGIVWAGNQFHQADKKRSLQLKSFERISALNSVKLFSLQKGERAKEILTNDFNVIDLDSFGLNDFSDTAAAIENLDLIITVDTSVAHLAGALAKRTWLLLPFYPDWRWQLNREDSPWYPAIKIFRQNNADDWGCVFEKVFDELKQNLEKFKRKESI